MSILVINAGSSSLKFALFDSDAVEERASGWVDWKADPQNATLTMRRPGAEPIKEQAAVPDYALAVSAALRLLGRAGLLDGPRAVTACGHRVVHGGLRFRSGVRLTPEVKAALAELSAVAPLHNPPALMAIDAAEAALPGVPQVAAFDTAFFADLPPRAYVYPLPYEWYSDWGIRRFGFHGISHAYCAERAAELLPAKSELRLVICHLGNGCSATAVCGGKPVTTTMGFTPMEGLMMGTRSGSVDPGILLHVLRQHGVRSDRLDTILNKESGLLGVSGASGDFRSVEEAAAQGNERARLALDLYADRVRATVGALAVTLGGVEALVFTAGVGENAAAFREQICNGLECLGLRLDPERNRAARPDADVADVGSPGRILLVHTREEQRIAREVQQIVSATDG